PELWANDQEYLMENVYLEEDDDEAIRLFNELKAEGVIPEGYVVRIHTPLDPRRRQLATIVAVSLIENGIDAVVIPLDWGQLLDLAYRSELDPVGDFEMMWIGGAGGPDPHDFAFYLFHSANATAGSANNMSWTMIPEVDALLDLAATTLDQTVREDFYVQAQRLIFWNYSAIPGYHYIQTTAINANVEGFLVHPMGKLWITTPYHNVWLE
ncbi:hypothetical protein KAH43_01355, partial [Candidatus Bipolaricaulota bacterium]|nr:hypothetical protein [Candidatus Bipolaricaulota bacterium]